MAAFSPGQRIAASWLGSGLQPATVIEVNSVSGLLKVQFDDGREAWIASMNARAVPNSTPASTADAAPSSPGPFQPVSPGAAIPPTMTTPAVPPVVPAPQGSPVNPTAPTQPLPVASPPAPDAPAMPGDFRPIQGAPLDGAVSDPNRKS